MFETMYSIKRIIAYCIDAALVYAIGFGVSLFSMLIFREEMLTNIPLMTIFSIVSSVVSYGIPILGFGILSGLFGWTPGKLICFLRVQNTSRRVPGIAQGILREIIKYVSVSLMFLGAIWAIQGIVTRQRTFYDEWLSLDVEDQKPSGLTDTQKNWRNTFRDK
jgi:uncharacterized RDD family membrane protein YckC